jgi:hypothetical protein
MLAKYRQQKQRRSTSGDQGKAQEQQITLFLQPLLLPRTAALLLQLFFFLFIPC